MSYKIIGGASQRFYHAVSTDLDLITTTPTREGIFKYLSQIGYDKFPEFILDILVKVEGHSPGDVTDGQGDEKQDIITFTPTGERCLTQCKHTINYEDHYNGDDLDKMVSATMRKNCRSAIFVTNSDLTPQGKKYITDDEYNRGISNLVERRSIDYWNGYKIWERIKNNQDIINKWFSGLGQVHGLRTFKFDITVQQMPYRTHGATEGVVFERIVEILNERGWISAKHSNDLRVTSLSKDYVVGLSEWYQFESALDINFALPTSEISFVNRPMFALSVEVTMMKSEKYSPSLIRAEIVNKICHEVLHQLADQQWWHITTSPIKSFIYLHDIAEPREIKLASAMTFVKARNEVVREFDYCNLSAEQFDFDGETIWVDKTSKIQIIQSFDQQLNPVEVYNHQISQYHDLKKMESFNFFGVTSVDSTLLMKLRRVLKKDWVALQFNDDGLIWGINPEEDEKEIEHYHQTIRNLQLNIKPLHPDDVASMLSSVQKDLPPPMSMYVSELSEISYPVNLSARMFWLSKDLLLTEPLNVERASNLIVYKFSLERQFGFDNLNNKTQERFNPSEIPSVLFDFFTFRGRRMLDIGSIRSNPISINMRFKENRTEPSNELVQEFMQEFLVIYEEIRGLLDES